MKTGEINLIHLDVMLTLKQKFVSVYKPRFYKSRCYVDIETENRQCLQIKIYQIEFSRVDPFRKSSISRDIHLEAPKRKNQIYLTFSLINL